MSTILDICVCAIIALTVIICAKRGFFKSLIKIGSVVAAVIMVIAFFTPLKARILSTNACADVREKMNARLAEIVSSETDQYDPDEVKDSPKFLQILDVLGIKTESFERTWNSWRYERTEELRAKLVNYISEPLMNMLASVLAFLMLFFGTMIVVRLIGFILDKIFVLPVLKQANTLLGFLLGCVIAAAYVYAFVYVVNLALPYLQAQGYEQLMRIDPEKTYIFKWFAHHDILTMLLGK